MSKKGYIKISARAQRSELLTLFWSSEVRVKKETMTLELNLEECIGICQLWGMVQVSVTSDTLCG